MKKIITTILLTISLSVFAGSSKIDQYMQNKNLVLQILGAGAYYEDHCQGFTTVGDFYRNSAMTIHDFEESDLITYDLFRAGYDIAAYYGNCEKIAKEFKQLGLKNILEES